MRVAFIGLGVMGFPMAENLRAAGHEVIGYNRSAGKRERFAARGGLVTESIAEAVAGAKAVFTMLPDSPDAEEAYLGAGGVLDSASPDTLLVDTSTIRPDVAVRLSAAAAERGFDMLDAPVSGGEKGAQDATLSIMVGGTKVAFERARPLLEALGTTIVVVGGAGTGQTVKAANQLLVAGTIQLVSEALVFLDAFGVQLDSAVEVLNGGLAGNTVLTRKARSMLDGDFSPGFRVELHCKDLGIYQDSARAAGVFSPTGALMAQLMNALKATGGGALDHSALLIQVDRLSGRDHWSAS